MTAMPSGPWEDRLSAVARGYPYPATPPIWTSVRTRMAPPQRVVAHRTYTWVRAAAVLFLLVFATMVAVPEVRAALARALQVGVVRIFVPVETPTPTTASATAAATPTAEVLLPPLDLAGRTTLEGVREAVPFPVRLPVYPENLGPPDLVFLQSADGPMVVLLWTDPVDAFRARLALHLLGPETFAGKGQPRIVAETEVHGQKAVWTEGPHSFVVRSGDYVLRTLVTGNVLIWTEGDITYRLETNTTMLEAVRIAESLR
jgi:hypothetical protein